jgi:hypothetical protein
MQTWKVEWKHVADSSKYKDFTLLFTADGYLILEWINPEDSTDKMLMFLEPKEVKKLIYFLRDVAKLGEVK